MSAATGLATSSLGELKQIDAGVLEVGYVDVGPANGRAVILLHGWPYDVHNGVQRRKARPAVMEMPGVKLLEVRSPRAGSAAETS